MPSQNLNGFAPAKKSSGGNLPGFAPAATSAEPNPTPPEQLHVSAAPRVSQPQPPFQQSNAPHIGSNFPQPQQPTGGDFAGDLNPNPDPLRIGGGLPAGNLMGPDHPMFAGGPGQRPLDFNPSDPAGFGMRPRFDPFGPPGGPQEVWPDPNNPNNPMGGPRGRPQGGNPNPDHLPPPNSLGNNMFM